MSEEQTVEKAAPPMAETVEIGGMEQAHALIASAVEKGLPVETMERLLAMRKDLKREWAEEQYVMALSAFQAELPEIPKTKEVYDKQGKLRYKYAPLPVILKATREGLHKNGFSHNITTEQPDDGVTAIFHLHHVAGHSTETRFTVPIDKGAYMTAPQQVASALTYAKRYAFCDGTGIMTTDEDDDGQVPGPDAVEKLSNAQIALIDKNVAVAYGMLERLEFPKNVKDALQHITRRWLEVWQVKGKDPARFTDEMIKEAQKREVSTTKPKDKAPQRAMHVPVEQEEPAPKDEPANQAPEEDPAPEEKPPEQKEQPHDLRSAYNQVKAGITILRASNMITEKKASTELHRAGDFRAEGNTNALSEMRRSIQALFNEQSKRGQEVETPEAPADEAPEEATEEEHPDNPEAGNPQELDIF